MKKLALVLLLAAPAHAAESVLIQGVGAGATIGNPFPAGMVDGFDDGDDVNLWGGNMGTMPDASISRTYDGVVKRGAAGASLRLTYNVNAPGSWNGFWVQLSPSGAGVDVSTYSHLVFWITGNLGVQEHMKISLGNASGNAARASSFLYVHDYLDGGVTTDWREVRIPTAAFANLDSFADVKEIAFVFENAYAANSGLAVGGTVFIDDLAFATGPVSSLRLDAFNDNEDRHALGGRMGEFGANGTIGRVFSTATVQSAPRALQSTYNLSAALAAPAGHYFILGGGADGFAKQPVDLSAFRYLRFRAKGAAGGNPKSFSIQFESNAPTPVTSVAVDDLTTDWQTFNLDMNALSSLVFQKSGVKEVAIVYDRDRIVSNAGNTQGAVSFDDIQFVP